MKAVDSRPADARDALTTAKTVRDLIRHGAAYLEAAGLGFYHGTDNARDEAASLVLHVLQMGYEQPDAALDREVTRAQQARVIDLLDRRVTTRRPAAYLIREAWFAGLPFFVDERVLVPRSPLAELIESQFTPWVNPVGVHRILDLCTGSGCIGIACAHHFPSATVTLADVSSDALEVARINVARHGLEDRVTIRQSDVFAALEGQCYDIIVSNPPYVPHDEMNALPAEFRHEPALGLVAGAEGLDIVVRILRDAARHLATSGILVVEVGNTQDRLVERFPEIPFTWLDFAYGGDGVFLLEHDRLEAYQAALGRGSN